MTKGAVTPEFQSSIFGALLVMAHPPLSIKCHGEAGWPSE
jgi:hypothetical protein